LHRGETKAAACANAHASAERCKRLNSFFTASNRRAGRNAWPFKLRLAQKQRYGLVTVVVVEEVPGGGAGTTTVDGGTG